MKLETIQNIDSNCKQPIERFQAKGGRETLSDLKILPIFGQKNIN